MEYHELKFFEPIYQERRGNLIRAENWNNNFNRSSDVANANKIAIEETFEDIVSPNIPSPALTAIGEFIESDVYTQLTLLSELMAGKIGKDEFIESIIDQVQNIASGYIKVSGNPIHITDASSCYVHSISVDGRTTYPTTPVSPTSPQNLISVGDGGSIDFIINKRNILVNELADTTINGLTIKRNGDGTIMIVGTSTADTEVIVNNHVKVKSGVTYFLSDSIYGIFPNGNCYLDFGGFTTKTGNVEIPVTSANENTLTTVKVVVKSNSNCNVRLSPQLEISDAHNYELYEKHIFNIPLSSPLMGIEDSKDYIGLKNDLYGVYECIDKYIINGTEHWNIDNTTYSQTVFSVVVPIPNMMLPVASNKVSIMSTGLLGISSDDSTTFINTDNKDNLVFVTSNSTTGVSKLFFRISSCNTLADFTNYLSLHPVTLYYQRKVPTFNEFNEVIQSVFKTIRTYTNITNIFNSYDADMTCEYIVDTKVYLKRAVDSAIAEVMSKYSPTLNYRIYADNASRDADTNVTNGTMCVVLNSTHSYTVNNVKPNLDISALTIDKSVTPDTSEDKVIVCFPNCNATYKFMLGQVEIKNGVLYLGEASRNKVLYNGSWNDAIIRQFQLYYSMLGKTGEVTESLPWLCVTVATPYVMFMYKNGAWSELTLAPVRGVDYWNDIDIAEIKKYVDDAILGGKW